MMRGLFDHSHPREEPRRLGVSLTVHAVSRQRPLLPAPSHGTGDLFRRHRAIDNIRQTCPLGFLTA